MTDFTREAARLLRATEDALYHRRPMTGLFDQVSQSPMRKRVGGADEDLEGVSNFPMQASWFSNAKGCRGGHVCDSAASITELERQLRIVMREVSDLRCELAAERETRSSALTALGRRWKEEVLLEVRASEYQSRRVIDNLVVSLEQQRQEDGTARSLLQQRVEDLLRDSKVRDRTHFDAQEQLREQVDAMRERLESAVSECALLRVECVQHQERENSAMLSGSTRN
nr:unnamed protein product [Trypanosoma congolense IL3000]